VSDVSSASPPDAVDDAERADEHLARGERATSPTPIFQSKPSGSIAGSMR
jgi:hypothetical protein